MSYFLVYHDIFFIVRIKAFVFVNRDRYSMKTVYLAYCGPMRVWGESFGGDSLLWGSLVM